MSTRETIKLGLASITWWMAWSDHAEEHCCASLSGMEISEIAPKVPTEILERAEEALQKIETRLKTHKPLLELVTRHAARVESYTEEDETIVNAALMVAACEDVARREEPLTPAPTIA